MPLTAAAVAPSRHRMVRLGYFALGLLMVGLGIIGALLPVMPTTIFMILAAACFGRSSPRFERWLLLHPRFGPPLRLWREQGAMSARAKMFACSGIAVGFCVFLLGARPPLPLALLVGTGMGVCAGWLLCRPLPRGAVLKPWALSGERATRTIAAAATVALHLSMFAALVWQQPAAAVAPPPAAERIQLVMLPPRAPQIAPEEQIAPTPSSAASVSLADQPTPPPLPPTPPRQTAQWALPPPKPPQPEQAPDAPPSTEASVAAAPPVPTLPPGPVASAPGQDSWEGRVMAELERHRRYPNAARARREQGTSIVKVSIARDGTLLELALDRSSGITRLDEAALQTFRRAQPLPPIPDSLPAPQVLALPVVFQMQ